MFSPQIFDHDVIILDPKLFPRLASLRVVNTLAPQWSRAFPARATNARSPSLFGYIKSGGENGKQGTHVQLPQIAIAWGAVGNRRRVWFVRWAFVRSILLEVLELDRRKRKRKQQRTMKSSLARFAPPIVASSVCNFEVRYGLLN